MTTPRVVTSDLIGDRGIDERDFGKIQRDRVLEMQRWVEELKSVQRFERNVKVAIVSANNHYAGLGPGTVNIFRRMLKLPGLSWENEKDLNQFDDTGHGNEKLIRQKQKQTSISDFLG